MTFSAGDVVRFYYMNNSDYGVLDKIEDTLHWSYWTNNCYSHCSKESLTLVGPSVLGKWNEDCSS